MSAMPFRLAISASARIFSGFAVACAFAFACAFALTLAFALAANSALAQVSADQQQAPRITRAVAADFASETFTLNWRAPENFGETILGYHIRRQQNGAQNPLSQNHHPTDCDALTDAQYRWSDNTATAQPNYSFLTGGITVAATVFLHAEQASTTGESHGNCYRWHISAFSATRAGPTVVTDPILSRSNAGRAGCNEGHAKPWAQTSPYSGVCVAQDRLEGLDWCAQIGGTLAAGDTQCQTPAEASCASGGFAEASASLCNINDGGLCQTNERFNLDHRECLCFGWATPKSDGTGCECAVGNANSLCECPLGSVYSPESNACECPAGLNPVSDTTGGGATICVPDAPAQVAQKCRDAGWDIVVSGGTFGAFCNIPYRIYGETSTGGRLGTECLIHGTSTSHLLCEDIFGTPVNFPKASEHPNVDGGANTDRFVANCDLHGAAPGGIPAAEITGETECQCDEFSTPNAAWPNCRPALVDYDYLKHHCPFGGDFPKQLPGYEAYRTTNNTAIGALCFFAGFSPNARGCIGVEPAHTRAPRSEFWNDVQNSYFGPVWAAHDIGVCEEWLPFCPTGQADRDGNFFTLNDCEPAPSVVFDVSSPQGGTLLAEWKSAGIDPVPMRSGAPLPVVAATVTLQLTLAAGWEHLQWHGDCAAFPANQPCQITTALGKTSYAVSARLDPECPRGTVRNDQLVCVDAPPDVKCLQAQWQTVGVGETATECQIPNYDPVAENSLREDSCSFTLGGDGTLPGCDQIFGATLAFPVNPDPTEDLADLPAYLYNCDPDGTRGLVPATANTVGATNCSCVDSTKLRIGEDTFDTDADGNAIYTHSACVDDASESGAQDCVDSFWDLSAESGGKCVIPLSQGGTLSLSGCFLSGEAAPQCDEVFPVDDLGDILFPFPLDLEDDDDRFVFNCGAGGFPQVNADGETACIGGDAARIKTGLAACDDKGWLDDAVNEKCDISTAVRGTLNTATSCYFSGESQPKCSDIFGPDFDFPENPNDETPPVYAYNCDPDGTSGLLPATFADGKTSCQCSGFGKSVDENGVCVCSAGETASPVQDICVADSIFDGVSKCEEQGWRLVGVQGGVGCTVQSVDLSQNSVESFCEFTENGSAASCTDIFGPNFDFPPSPEEGGRPYYFHNCDPDGDSGLLPATFANGETESCKCPSGMVYVGGMTQLPFDVGGIKMFSPYGGACVSAEVAEGLEKCHDAEWDVSDEGGGKCEIPTSLRGTVAAEAECYFSGESRPQCADIFGPELNFPDKPSDDPPPAYAYNCDPDGTSGFIPATFADGKTSCECSGFGKSVDDSGVCVCSAGETASPVNDFCVADTILDGVSKCENAGWPLGRHIDGIGGELFECVVPAVDVANSRGYTTCEFKELSPYVVNCADIFTEDFDFPTLQEVARHYFYNCDPDGDSGLLPATFATDETESCKCPSGMVYVGGMRLSSASTGLTTPYGGACVLPEVSEGLEKCHDAGWDVSVSDEGGGKCAIPLVEAEGSARATVFAGCFAGGESEPQCADVFGSGLSFPTAGSTEVTFAFNCGATRVPEDVNLNGATSCECVEANNDGTCAPVCGGGRVYAPSSGECACSDDGSVYDLGGACVPTESADAAAGEVFGGLADDELCARFGGMVEDEGGGRVCGGLDEAGTFCILDSAGEDPAFPCRGLFKHLRRCNGLYERPALNPFICGEKCDNRARGRHCL